MGSRKDKVQESKVARQTLDDPELQTALQVFCRLLDSATGPHGRVQSVQNSVGGPLTTTTSSVRLLYAMSFSRPCLRLIATAVQGHLKNHHDGGLLTGSLCLHLIAKAVEEEGAVRRKCVREVYEWVMKYVDEYLTSDTCPVRLNVDLADLKVALAFVRSIISTKPVCGILVASAEHLSQVILKAFLTSVPDVPKSYFSDRVFMLTFSKTSLQDCQMLDGLLLEWPEKSSLLGEQELECLRDSQGKVRVALVSVSMSGDAQEALENIKDTDRQTVQSAAELVMTKMIEFCDWLLSRRVGLLLCQKVIHPKVKSYLRTKRILFVERLGLHPMAYIQDLTGAHSISSVLVHPLDSAYGYLSSVSHRVLHKKSYLHLQNAGSCVCCLLLCAPMEQQTAELKSVVQSALSGLHSLMRRPVVLCGGGCWQIHLAHWIHHKVHEQQDALCAELHITRSQLYASTRAFTASLQATATSVMSPAFHPWVDEDYYHMWHIPKGVDPTSESTLFFCACGMLSVADVDRKSLRLLVGRQEEGVTARRRNDFDALNTGFDGKDCVISTGLQNDFETLDVVSERGREFDNEEDCMENEDRETISTGLQNDFQTLDIDGKRGRGFDNEEYSVQKSEDRKTISAGQNVSQTMDIDGKRARAFDEGELQKVSSTSVNRKDLSGGDHGGRGGGFGSCGDFSVRVGDEKEGGGLGAGVRIGVENEFGSLRKDHAALDRKQGNDLTEKERSNCKMENGFKKVLSMGENVRHEWLVVDGLECVMSAVHTAIITAVTVLSISQYIHDVN